MVKGTDETMSLSGIMSAWNVQFRRRGEREGGPKPESQKANVIQRQGRAWEAVSNDDVT